MSESFLPDSSPEQMARMLRVSDSSRAEWRPDELGAVLRHQLSAPVGVDLGAMQVGMARKLQTTAAAQGLLLNSFAELLLHPAPPLELLTLAKDFAKANRSHPDSALPSEIATVLYFATLAAALVRLHCRISRLKDAELMAGFDWCRRQQWLDERLRALLQQAAQVLSPSLERPS